MRVSHAYVFGVYLSLMNKALWSWFSRSAMDRLNLCQFSRDQPRFDPAVDRLVVLKLINQLT